VEPDAKIPVCGAHGGVRSVRYKQVFSTTRRGLYLALRETACDKNDDERPTTATFFEDLEDLDDLEDLNNAAFDD
jgi:hypothetical protein